MAEIADEIIIKIRADVAELKKGLDSANKKISEFSKKGSDDAKSFGKVFETAVGFLVAQVANKAAQSISSFVTEGVKGFAQYEQTLSSFKYMTGIAADGLLDAMDRAAEGTVSKMDLVRQANTAMVLGIEQEMLPKLVEISRASAKVLGGDTQFMFESLVTGIGRQSRLMLDNLGIIVKIGDAQLAYAKSVGKTVEELTDEEKALAFRNSVLEAGNALIDKAAGSETELADALARNKKAVEELKVAFGEAISPAVTKSAGILTQTFNNLGFTLKEMSTWTIQGVLSGASAELKEAAIAADEYRFFTEALAAEQSNLKMQLESVALQLNSGNITVDEATTKLGVYASALQLEEKTVQELKEGYYGAYEAFNKFLSARTGLQFEGETEADKKKNRLLLQANQYQQELGITQQDALKLAEQESGFTLNSLNLEIEAYRLKREAIRLSGQEIIDQADGVLGTMEKEISSVQRYGQEFLDAKTAIESQIAVLNGTKADYDTELDSRISKARDLRLEFEAAVRASAKLGSFKVSDQQITSNIRDDQVRMAASQSMKKYGIQQDFVMRPGQAPVPFSSNDTITGSKSGMLGGVTINIGTVQGLNPDEVARALEKKLGSLITR